MLDRFRERAAGSRCAGPRVLPRRLGGALRPAPSCGGRVAGGVGGRSAGGPCDEKTYLRVHPLDTRRRDTTPLTKPMSAPAAQFELFDSPDVVIRPAPPVSTATMPKTPPDAFFPIDKNHHSCGFELWTFQTAFKGHVPACRPTGNWTDAFETLLVAYKTDPAVALGASPSIDKATWENVVTQARVYQPPWGGPSPTEADLAQLVWGEGFTLTPTRFTARRLNVDVLVHQRGLQPLPAANAPVLLLLRKLTESEAAWPTLAISGAWKTATVSALDTGTAPGGGWPDKWVVADTTPVRHPAGSMDASQPQAATFTLIFPPPPRPGSTCCSPSARRRRPRPLPVGSRARPLVNCSSRARTSQPTGSSSSDGRPRKGSSHRVLSGGATGSVRQGRGYLRSAPFQASDAGEHEAQP